MKEIPGKTTLFMDSKCSGNKDPDHISELLAVSTDK
jgi:hypothetical protein